MLEKQYQASLITLSVHLAEGQAGQMFVVFAFNQLMWSTTKSPRVCLCLSLSPQSFLALPPSVPPLTLYDPFFIEL